MIKAIIRFFRVLLFGVHDWEYRTPYARKCKRCGCSQNYVYDVFVGGHYWEEMYPLPHSPEKCDL